MKRFISAAEAAALLRDGDTLAIGGFGPFSGPDGLLQALADRFQSEAQPAGLTTMCGISAGNNDRQIFGLNRLALPGLIRTHIAAHIGNPALLREMADRNELAFYALPLGVVTDLWRAIGSGKKGVLTPIGLGTFADPRENGCRMNEAAERQGREIVKLLDIDGDPQLFFPSFPINACFLKASCADEQGNLSVEREAVVAADLEIAAATKNSGGIVIAQVEEIVPGPIPAKQVRIHSSLVDYIAVVPRELARQSYSFDYRPELAGLARVAADAVEPMPFSVRKVIARRAAMELTSGCVVNLGIGLPSGVGPVSNEEGIESLISMESGPIGGIPLEGAAFGAAANPECIQTLCDTLNFYDGGYLDVSFLGCAEIDRHGNVNVSKFGGRCTGPGGFVDISQNTPRLFFLSTFTTSGGNKFVEKVEQITFSAEQARKLGQEVAYITERAVFRLGERGLVLTEIAPGVDVERDILPYMDFVPEIAADLKTMDSRLFEEARMGIADGR